MNFDIVLLLKRVWSSAGFGLYSVLIFNSSKKDHINDRIFTTRLLVQYVYQGYVLSSHSMSLSFSVDDPTRQQHKSVNRP